MKGPLAADIYTEPKGDPNTLANLGPLRPMAGVWLNDTGVDDHPVVDGARLRDCHLARRLKRRRPSVCGTPVPA